eukprot:CAMPEP_0176144520 /NCGR_PEP_ID=MMETSP0120_2-20121206/73584_1 /TAXON_ID=160619 /ORGANISM="Kryptoperidinium foliaceum, Strain CCMP 1326" /LENGTH=419 /DNA_ID=CAMNT_0017480901 /DNA_START=16 /DNA_END=1275 /DNA_ORIENTATION=-
MKRRGFALVLAACASLDAGDGLSLVSRSAAPDHDARNHLRRCSVNKPCENTSAEVARGTKQMRLQLRAGQVPAPGTWTSGEPDSKDYNEETRLRGFGYSAEKICALLYCVMLASTPFLLASLAEQQLTRAHMLESVFLTAWLGAVIYLFTHVVKFQSIHWDGYRPLTLVESVYLISQILTTVGYGDITPAFPRGQVWVAFNVIVALCLYGSIICEVVQILRDRIHEELMEDEQRTAEQPLKDWSSELTTSKGPLITSLGWFLGIAAIGVLFWHFYPGEGKTWMQATYMSVITLSTVGFGAFTATTEGGKVFAAFWMLAGVAALGALISGFINTMMLEKKVERRCLKDLQDEFRSIMQRASGGRAKMSKADFLKFGLMLSKKMPDQELKVIEHRYRNLLTGMDDHFIRRNALVDNEGPPL